MTFRRAQSRTASLLEAATNVLVPLHSGYDSLASG